ncbi:ATPase [Puteibacter caeruleilacunae]|nr:ATPase [Puteibacter caeruleilacunae]
MIIIADSGSTKTDWRIISENNTIQLLTDGINPFFQDSNEILSILKPKLPKLDYSQAEVYFYGAGCSFPEKKAIVRTALQEALKPSSINIESDLLAAARALCQNQKGIACILGTGSNSCLYNGNEITHNVSPLGYILGDEGSGAVMGKRLIADLLKNQLSDKLKALFFKEYETSHKDILDSVYKQPFPNRYLAQFTKFLKKHISNEEIEALVKTELKAFISRNISQYKDYNNTPIHFIGSIAYHFKNQLEEIAVSENINIQTIEQTPMEGLIKYHTSSK